MTDDEIFTAIYLVCGALPTKPQSQNMISRMGKMYRRRLPDGREQSWIVDDENDDRRHIYDPAYMEYISRAYTVIPNLDDDMFVRFIKWAEAHEQGR